MKPNKLSKKIISTCFLSGCLEIYDFIIFGFFSTELHANYLVFLNEDKALLASYALFAVGFLFRPLGAIIFGHIGDKYGRKKALIISLTIMGLTSLSMAILPAYNSIGIVSCYILVGLRILQGLSVGGEYSGAIIFAVEHSKKIRSGLVGSIVVSGCMSGVLLATLVSSILKSPSMPEYSWRYAFLLGFVLSLIGYFIRKEISETPEFNDQKLSIVRAPLLQGLYESKVESLVAIFVAATSGVNLYFITIFMPNYVKHLGNSALNLATLSTFIMVLLIPMFGNLSDKLNRVNLMLMGASLLTVYSLILPTIIYKTNNYSIAVFAIIVHAIIASIFCGPMNTLIVEIFQVSKRYSCSAFSYSIGMGIIGGTTPMIASLINHNTNNNPIYIGAYISFITLCGLLSLVGFSFKQSNKLRVVQK